MAFMVMGVYLLVKSRYKGHYKRDKANDLERDNLENSFRVLVGVLRGSVKLKVRRSADQPMDSCQIARTTSRCGRQQWTDGSGGTISSSMSS